MSMAIVGDVVLREVSDADLADEAAELMAEARAEAVEALRELHRIGVTEHAVADPERDPHYWLGRLEGVVLGLVVAMDLAMEAG